MSLVEKYSTGESPVKFGEDAYFITRVIDYLFREGMEDRAVQRTLRDIDNSDLALIMKALSGEARGHIFNNLSQRLAVMIAEDIEYMGRVPLSEITEAEYKVLRVIVKLYARGEIVVRDGAMIENFAKVIGISFDSRKQNEELNIAEDELEMLLREYTKRDRRLI
jgi:acetylglutamate kinase